MDSGASCFCDSSEPSTDPAQYLEGIKKKYLDRTAKLQTQQKELEKRIMQMEMFLGEKDHEDNSGASSCSCDTPGIPKVFPETPVRDVPRRQILASTTSTPKPTEQCSFFQKFMENAKSILSLKCQCAFISTNSTSITPRDGTTSDFTPSDPPTREVEPLEPPKVVEDEENTFTDKSSKTSICTCDESDPSTLQEVSCSCHMDVLKPQTVPQGEQVSLIEPSSSTPKDSQEPTTTSKSEGGVPPISPLVQYSKSSDRNTNSSDLTSSCSCNVCKCNSSIIDDQLLDLDNFPADLSAPVPKIAVFSGKGDNNLNAEVQATTTVHSMGLNIQIPKDTASKCVTCCRTLECPTNRNRKEMGDNLSAGVQVASPTQNKSVNISIPKDTLNVAVTCCRSKYCPKNQKKPPCRGKCNISVVNRPGRPDGPDGPGTGAKAASAGDTSKAPPFELPVNVDCQCSDNALCDRNAQATQYEPNGQRTFKFDACFEKCETTRQDGQNQCAFVGSPLLNPRDFEVTKHVVQQTVGSKVPCECSKRPGQNTIVSLTSVDIQQMQNIAELAKQEKEIKAQIEQLQKRERAYQEATKDMNTLVTTANECCVCQKTNKTSNVQDEIQKISQELRLENQILKAELMDMKVQLKHCLEKVEGPMKQKLETEKQKCEVLQRKLQDASKSMLLNEDTYSREMSELKLQLCCACSNITELNQMNNRLKNEMSQLDCLCAKLEDDLVKQKINEADTIKRLTNRRFSGDGPHMQQAEEFRCDSNLDVIARKLSKTLKELAPCEECSKLPTELAGAARCIKELTDLVRKRRTKSSSSYGCSCSSKPLSKPASKEFSEEECCTCCSGPAERSDRKETVKARKRTTTTFPCGCQAKVISKPSSKEFSEGRKCSCSGAPKDGGGEPDRKAGPAEEKTVRTLLSVPETFVQKGISSKFEVTTAVSSFYSATGQPVREERSLPCAKIGAPCLESKGTITKIEGMPKGELPDSDIGEHGQKEKPEKYESSLESRDADTKQDVLNAPTDKLPCSDIGEPCQKDKKPKPDVTTTETPTVDKSFKAPSSGMIAAVKDEEVSAVVAPKDKETEMPAPEEIEKRISTTSSTKRDIASITYELVDRLPDTTPEEPVTDTKLLNGVGQGDLEPSKEQIRTEPSEDGGKAELLDAADIKTEPKDELAEPAGVEEEIISALDIEPITYPIKAEQAEVEPIEQRDTDADTDIKADVKDEIKTEQFDVGPEKEKYDESEEYDHKFEEAEEYEEPEEYEEYEEPDEYEQVEPPAKGIKIEPREIPFDEERFGDFPVDVQNKAFAVDEPPDGLHVTTTITGSGTLEVITEGPGGTIETTMTYTNEGNIEVVTEMIEYPEDQKTSPTEQALEKYTTEPTVKVPGVPEGEFHDSEKFSGTDESTTDRPPSIEGMDRPKPKLLMFPIESSKISGPSGPETDTPYTPSSVSGEGNLTSKLGSDSSGIQHDLDATPPDGTSDVPVSVGSIKEIGDKVTAEADYSGAAPEAVQPTTVAATVSEIKDVKSGEGTTPSAQDAIRQEVDRHTDTLTSEGVTSTDVDLPSGEVFTPDQIVSDEEPPSQPAPQEGVGTPKASKLDPIHSKPVIKTEESDTIKPLLSVSRGTTPIKDQKVKSIEFGDVPGSEEVTVVLVRSSLDPDRKVECEEPDAAVTGKVESTSPAEGNTKETDLTWPEYLAHGTSLTGAGPTRDCSCQSKDQKDQSCQCCECKTIGVTTSGDKETITAEEDDMCKTPKEEPKTDTDSEFVTTSEITDNAFAERTITKKSDLSKTDRPRDWGLIIDQEMLKKHPELAGRTSEEQHKILKNLGYVMSKERIIEDLVDDFVVLTTRSKEDQKRLIKNLDYYVPSEIVIDEEMLRKHPQLAGISEYEQQKILKDLGYGTSRSTGGKMVVDDSMLEKHPELSGKTEDEQQEMLKNLGYPLSTPPKSVDEEILQKSEELVDEKQQNMVEDIGYGKSEQQPMVTQEILTKHPELTGKTSEQQQQMLMDLGYKVSKTASVRTDKDVLEKHPELVGKGPEQQQSILQEPGYAIPKTASSVSDQEMPEKLPEFIGKTSEQKQQVPTDVVYQTPKTTSIITDKDLLEKHPELVGKSPEQQQSILQKLGYVTQTASLVTDKEILKIHPKLTDESPKDKEEILDNFGYEIPKGTDSVVDQNLIKKHPELGDKSIVTPKTTSFVSDSKIIEKHPELIGESPEQQQQILEDLGYETSAIIDQQEMLKALESGLPNAKYIAEDSQMLKKHPELPDKLPAKQQIASLGTEPKSQVYIEEPEPGTELKPLSKEVSVTCKAPCRSVATIPADSSKSSDQTTTIGDVSLSKSISLQQRPSSRDDSASCKASCRNISVQSSKTKGALNRKEIEVLETARIASSTTTSSSDSREKEKAKRPEKAKSKPGEVPSIVSQLSDKERPVIEPTKKSKGQRKKRSARMMDCMKCICPDPCQCKVCSPDKSERRQRIINRAVRSCDCPPQIMMPPMPMAYSMPLPSHAPGCTCNHCILNPYINGSDFLQIQGRSMPEGESPTSDENDARNVRKHSSNCECVDCLCLPRIKKLAETKEYPVVYDKKQVYHVKTSCDTCVNAQNAKRYAEQQRSRIPISTSTPNPPKAKAESKPAASTSKVEDSAKSPSGVNDQKAAVAAQLSHSDSIYNSIACDCVDCKCADCPDPKRVPSKREEKPDEKRTLKSDKDCCCQGPCTCKPCTVEELTKKLQETEAQLASARSAPPAAPSAIPVATPSAASKPVGDGHDGECTCTECVCPRADLLPSKTGKPATAVVAQSKTVSTKKPSDECTCPECIACPRSDLMPKKPDGEPVTGKPSEMDDEEECTCPECVCPGADESKPSAPALTETSSMPTDQKTPDKVAEHPPDCDCPECVCPGLDGQQRKGDIGKAVPVAAEPSKTLGSGGGDDECDCTVCECPGKTSLPPKRAGGVTTDHCDCKKCLCSPCGDENKAKVPSSQPGAVSAIKSTQSGIADCDCADCKCSPCADPKKTKSSTAEPKVSEKMEKPAGEHPEECDCPVCACPSKESKAIGVPEKVAHPPNCDCDECLCLEQIIKSEEHHSEDCDCPICTCPSAGDVPRVESKGVGVPSEKGLQPTVDKEVHPSGCECVECKCPSVSDQAVHALNCACADCLCPECTVEAAHAPGCRCDKCVCQFCEYAPPGEAQAPPRQIKSPVGAAHPAECSCIKCICDECVDPSKKQTTLVTRTTKEHGGDCRCVECLCKECLMKLEPIKHEEGCKCAQCTCVECLRKISDGDKVGTQPSPMIAQRSAVMTSQAAEPQEGDVPMGDNCTCQHCICVDCAGLKKTGGPPMAMQKGDQDCSCVECKCDECTKKREAGDGKNAASAETSPTSPPPGHGTMCTCAICQCDPCVTKTGAADQPCSCQVCTCVECTKKREDAGDNKAASIKTPPPQGHDTNCTCVICQCDPCPKKTGSADQPCTCQVCTCLECTKKREAAGDNKVASTKPPPPPQGHDTNCTCVICQCDPCPKKTDSADQPCTCQVCTCLECTKKRDTETRAKSAPEKGDKATPSQEVKKSEDTVQASASQPAAKQSKKGGADTGMSLTDPPPFEPLKRVDCSDMKCDCVICDIIKGKTTIKLGADRTEKSADRMGRDTAEPPPFEVPVRIDCQCARCDCVFCNKQGPAMREMGAQLSRGMAGPPMKEMAAQPSKGFAAVPSAIASKTVSVQPSKFKTTDHPPGCICGQCICVTCEPVPGGASASQPSGVQQPLCAPGRSATPVHCDCPTCSCEEAVPSKLAPDESKKQMKTQPSVLVQQSGIKTQPSGVKPGPSGVQSTTAPVHCYCPTCTCDEGEIKTTTFASAPSTTAPSRSQGGVEAQGEVLQSAETVHLSKPTLTAHMVKVHPVPCDCAQCVCAPCPDPNVMTQPSTKQLNIQQSFKQMDNVTLAKSIQAANKENCECKEQIEEIKKTLERIKCACTEAEFRSTQSMAQTMGATMEATVGRPFVKQASVFGQTMSGLKMALANLQSKCKAKDKMIEVMTGELEIRGDPGIFDKVLDRAMRPSAAIDFDQAEDVKSFERSQRLNVLYGRETTEQGTVPCDLRCVASKGVEVRTHKHKKKKEKGDSSKKLDDCACSKPQIIQKEEKDCQKLDLLGFEVIDIRRITDDSLIVKWNPPKCNLVTGYDIFVNGTLASKVMSGQRTSAMMHSLDLSKSVQITIYAVSKCGRIEPPALAIYEIKG